MEGFRYLSCCRVIACHTQSCMMPYAPVWCLRQGFAHAVWANVPAHGPLFELYAAEQRDANFVNVSDTVAASNILVHPETQSVAVILCVHSDMVWNTRQRDALRFIHYRAKERLDLRIILLGTLDAASIFPSGWFGRVASLSRLRHM